MGSWFSKDEKKVETNGEITNSNNIVIEDAVTVESREIVILLLIITIIKLIEFAIYIYNNHVRKIKKKYSNNTTSA